jgi:hypothetical protein
MGPPSDAHLLPRRCTLLRDRRQRGRIERRERIALPWRGAA